MTTTILSGDCREFLKTLPDRSVQMCLTSPPYFGLRDYGTGTWEGGNAACDHQKVRDKAAAVATSTLDGGKKSTGHLQEGYTTHCRKCGAKRIDQQIGLEQTPDEFVAALVGVFREVKRVLRNDGVCLLNLGDSFCSRTQNVRYGLREDCTLEELRNVALAMFGVWVTGDKEESQGALPPVLPQSIYRAEVGGRPDVSGERIEAKLSAKPHSSDRAIVCTEQTDEDRRDKRFGREVRMLRGDDTAVPNAGSHQRRRCGTQKEDGEVHGQDLPASAARGIPEAQVSNPLLQLQLRDRLVGLLSAREFTASEVPASVRACFKAVPGLKPKDLIGIPWMVAFALRADGWYLRSDIVWNKPNPMPESCNDRTTKSHEYVFLLTKKDRYFWDAEAVREDREPDSLRRSELYGNNPSNAKLNNDRNDGGRGGSMGFGGNPNGRNLRSVWTIATTPFPGAHFATMPAELAERCIKAGSSERGCCPSCGAPWKRMIETEYKRHEKWFGDKQGARHSRGKAGTGYNEPISKRTTGWKPTCKCADHTPVPCTVLDPFGGAGTTGLVADRLGRNAVLIDLNPQYRTMARNRIIDDAPLFAEVAD